MAPAKVSAHDVFTVFSNGGGWPSTGVSVFVGLLGSVFATYGILTPIPETEITELTKSIVKVPTALFMYILHSTQALSVKPD